VSPGATIEVNVEGKNQDLSGKYTVGADGTLALSSFPAASIGGLRAREAGLRIGETLWGKAPAGGASVEVKTGSIAANFGVWAVGLMAGAAINIGYAAYLLTKRKSWGVLLGSGKEFILAIIIGVNFSVAVALMGKGMLLLGVLGGSVGWGIQQAMQMTGSQAVGFISGEWRGVLGRPRNQMILAIAVLMFAAVILAVGNTLAKS
jgi:hypothetical protein